MRILAEEPETLCDYTHEQLIKLGGTESVEVVNWLAMRGALPATARPVVEAYYAHRIMGYGLAGLRRSREPGMTAEVVARILEGAVDLHVHPAPSPLPRRIDAVEAAQAAGEVGMRGDRRQVAPPLDRHRRARAGAQGRSRTGGRRSSAGSR